MSFDERYARVEADCERLVAAMKEHDSLLDIIDDFDAPPAGLTHPDTFRRHGEYGLWVETVYEVLTERGTLIPAPILSQMQCLADQMGIRGDRIP